MFNVMGMRPDSLTALFQHLEPPTAHMLKMLESIVPLAPKEPSNFKEAMPLVDVWKSATTISGGQCVMTSGVEVMLWLLAGSLGSQLLEPQH